MRVITMKIKIKKYFAKISMFLEMSGMSCFRILVGETMRNEISSNTWKLA
jgi:hypothetical protein